MVVESSILWKITKCLSKVHGSYSMTLSRSTSFSNSKTNLLSPISWVRNGFRVRHSGLKVLITASLLIERCVRNLPANSELEIPDDLGTSKPCSSSSDRESFFHILSTSSIWETTPTQNQKEIYDPGPPYHYPGEMGKQRIHKHLNRERDALFYRF